MRKMPGPAGATIASALAVLAVGPSTLAALQDCSGIAQAGYKILLDDIRSPEADPNSEQFRIFHDRVKSALRDNLTRLELEVGIPISVVRCTNRSPTDESEFTPRRMEDLDVSKVLLEVWGFTESRQDPTGRASHEASLTYALIPIFRAAEQPTLVAFPSKSHHLDVASPAEGIADLFRGVDELGAYAVVSIGVKLSRLGQHAEALPYLCKGEQLLAQALAPGSLPAQTALLDFVKRTSAENFRKALIDPNHPELAELTGDSVAAAPCSGGGP